jgi:hypothetical protein
MYLKNLHLIVIILGELAAERLSFPSVVETKSWWKQIKDDRDSETIVTPWVIKRGVDFC